jgi:hypothetical protein
MEYFCGEAKYSVLISTIPPRRELDMYVLFRVLAGWLEAGQG